MANEFKYAATLRITHPSMHVTSITNVLSHLTPDIESSVGTDRRRRDGSLLEPRRKAKATYWTAQLIGERRLHSSEQPLSDFLQEQTRQLDAHQEFLKGLVDTGGVIEISLWLYSDTHYCADMLPSACLAKLASLRIDLELNVTFAEQIDGGSVA